MKELPGLVAHQVFDEMPRRLTSHETEFPLPLCSGIASSGLMVKQPNRLHSKFDHDKVYPKVHHSVLEVHVDLVACLELHYFDPGGKQFKLGDSLICNRIGFLADYANLKSTDLEKNDFLRFINEMIHLAVASSMSIVPVNLGRERDILTAFEDENDYVRMMCFDPGGGCHSSSDFAESTDASHKLKSDEFMLKNEGGETFSIFANVNPVAIDMMRIPFDELISTEESLLSGTFLDLHHVTGGKSSLWYLVFDPGISFKEKWVIETKIASMLCVALGSWKYPHSVEAQLADFAKLFCAMCLSSENESELVIHVIHFGSVINEVVAATLIVANIYGQRAALLKLFIGEEELKLAAAEIPYTNENSVISLHFQPCVSDDLPLEVDLPPNNFSYKALLGYLLYGFKLYDPGGEGYYLSDKTAVVELYYELSFEFFLLIIVHKNFGADLELGEAKIAQDSFESVMSEFRGGTTELACNKAYFHTTLDMVNILILYRNCSGPTLLFYGEYGREFSKSTVEIADMILKAQGHFLPVKFEAMGFCNKLSYGFQPLIPWNKSTGLIGEVLKVAIVIAEALHVKEAIAKVFDSRKCIIPIFIFDPGGEDFEHQSSYMVHARDLSKSVYNL